MKKIVLSFFLAATAMYAQAQLQSPGLLAPADSSINLLTAPSFNWSPALGGSVSGYELEIDDDINFGSPVPTTTMLGTTGASQGLLFGTRYYWRVRAIGVSGNSEWSDTLTFTTYDSNIPLISPGDSTTILNAEVDLRWNSLKDKVNFQFQLDTNASFSSPGLVSGPVTNPNNANGIVNTIVGDLYFGQLYFWRVRALNANDTSAWSEMFRFISPLALFPRDVENNATGISPDTMLRAFSMLGVDDYIFEIDSSATINTASKEYDNAINQSPTFAQTELLFGTDYFWRVKGRNKNGESAWSTNFKFTVASTIAHESPTDGEIVGQQPDLRWKALQGVKSYQYQVDDDATFASPTTVTVVGLNHAVSAKLNLGDYFWRIRGIHARDTSDWSAAQTFTVEAVGISGPENEKVLSIYPNPALNTISIALPENTNGMVEISITNLTGKVVLKEATQATSNVTVTLADEVSSGLYFVTVLANGNAYQQKLMVKK